jgi:predicted O-methyltransferase YrrM
MQMKGGLMYMRLENVYKIVTGLHGIPSERGKILYDFILKNKIQNMLELGFAHGKSTLFAAAALDEIGSGSIITIDLKNSINRKPNIDALLRKSELANYVKPIYADRSYTWELMKMIDEGTHNNSCKKTFDFCFIDGAHTWDVDGFAFFLVEKLLKPGAFILFDDLGWTIDNGMPEDVKNKALEIERKTAQVGKIFSLLVKQHPNFINIKDDGWWGWAQKKS